MAARPYTEERDSSPLSSKLRSHQVLRVAGLATSTTCLFHHTLEDPADTTGCALVHGSSTSYTSDDGCFCRVALLCWSIRSSLCNRKASNTCTPQACVFCRHPEPSLLVVQRFATLGTCLLASQPQGQSSSSLAIWLCSFMYSNQPTTHWLAAHHIAVIGSEPTINLARNKRHRCNRK